MVLAVGLCRLQVAISAPALDQGRKETPRLKASYEKPVGLTAPGSIILKRETT
jgi:hypothetical protein